MKKKSNGQGNPFDYARNMKVNLPLPTSSRAELPKHSEEDAFRLAFRGLFQGSYAPVPEGANK